MKKIIFIILFLFWSSTAFAVTRYVNTDSTPGGNGTTPATTGANRAYASLSEWEDAEDDNALTEPHIVYCIGGTDSTAKVKIDDWTGNSATNTITIKAYDSTAPNYDSQYLSVHDGTRGSGFVLNPNASWSHTLDIAEQYTYIEGIEVSNQGTNVSTGILLFAANCRAIDCLVYDLSLAATYGAVTVWNTNSEVINTVVMNTTGRGIYINFTAYVYNCVVVNSSAGGIETRATGTAYAKNCYSGGNANDYVNGNALHCTNSMASDTSFADNVFDTETNCTDSIALATDSGVYFTNVIAGSEDVHIGSSSSLIEAGADLDADANWVKDTYTDWEDDTRDALTPDIGADEYMPAAIVTVTTGTAYDSQTGKTIKDASVTLYKADSTIYTSTPQPNSQTTNNEGKFLFEVEAGKYYLAARHKDYKDYKSSVFTLTGSFVTEDITMEPLNLVTGQYLSISKTVNKKTATIGDILTYAISVENMDAALSATTVTISDYFPHDFKYVAGTSKIDDSLVTDPTNRRTPSWLIGTLTAGQSTTLTYRVIVGPDAELGRNKNAAIVGATINASSASAGPSIAVVDVKEGLFSKKGMIIGKVFHDKDEDSIQDAKEKGIPYVSLILEDGTMITTDEHGRYSMPDISVGMHSLRLDQRMLEGGPLTKGGPTTHDPQSAIQKKENLVERRNLGDWIEEKLYDNEEDEIASSPEPPLNNSAPHYRSDIPEVSKFVQVPESGTAKCNFPIKLLTPDEEKLQKERHAKETQFMLVGIADGTVGYLKSTGKVKNIGLGDNIGPSLEVNRGLYADGKVVLYAKGKIKGEYLLTTRYDSTRNYHEHLYSWINPEKYYPLYGDESGLTNDADSPIDLFVRIDKDSSYAMLGSYETNEFTETELSSYQRTLHGVTAHVKSKDFFKNVIASPKGAKQSQKEIASPSETSRNDGAPDAEISFFGAKTLQEKRQDIFAGRGISGPYYLTRIPILEETEKIAIEVHDTSRYELVLNKDTKSRNIDYELDYTTGRLMFKEPVPTYDRNNDPVYIVVDYEYATSNDDKYYITGTRGEITLFDKLKLGTQVIIEDREAYFYNLVGADSIWEVTPNTRLQAEWAYSRTSDKIQGNALRIEGSSVLLNNKLRLQAYAAQIGEDFSNPVNVTEDGVEKYGITKELDITDNLILITDHWVSRSTESKIYDRQTTSDLIYKNDTLYLSGGYSLDEIIDEIDDTEDTHTHGVNLRGGVKVTPNVIASSKYSWQKEPHGGEINKFSPRLDVKLNEDTSVYARHDYTREEADNEGRSIENHISSVGFMRQEDDKRSYIEYGFVGSKLDKTTFGIEEDILTGDGATLTSYANQVISKDKNEENIGYNSRVKLFKDFYVGGNFESTRTTGDTDYTQTAVSVTTDYLKNSGNAFGTKFEFRDIQTKREYNLGVDSKLNINDSTYLLAKLEYHKRIDEEDNEDLRETKRIISGIGYRPVNNDKLNLLAKYEYEDDLDMISLSISDYASHLASIEAIYDITPKWEIFGKYALKSSLENASGIKTHSLTDLKTAKLIYKFTPYLDLGGTYRILQNYNTDTIKQGAAGEVGVTVFNHLRVAVGYNFLDYSDREYPAEDYQGIGPYIQMTYKFDISQK
jgi:uncharacterized repeat protein (TIGR01451 family)